ncbi:MAG: N-acetylmuramoyl-L-alanine amidase [Schaedlerella sp.]|nr:N-acetylmuramoyl-L-alanine amidase [Schaedlerella sp.]
MRKKAGIFLTILIFAAVVAGMHQAANLLYENVISKEVVSGVKKIKIVIDSGHGGADPGKVGINQVLEKDINLKIAEKLKKMLEDESVEIVMTREGEGGLSDSKTEDMKKE